MNFPIQREWITLHDSSNNTSQCEPIKLFTYNILAQSLFKREMFPHVGKVEGKFKFRSVTLLKEILDSKADIICLQEVDFVEDFWKPELAKHGYEMVHQKHPKERDISSIVLETEINSEQNEFLPYGIAIAFKKSKFESLHYESFQYGKQFETWCKQESIQHWFTTLDLLQLLNQTNVAQLLVLQWKNTNGNKFGCIISNNHLYWRPDGAYTRLIQFIFLMQQIQRLQKQFAYPFVICGDLNCTPNNVFYDMMTKKRIYDPIEENDRLFRVKEIPSTLKKNFSTTLQQIAQSTQNCQEMNLEAFIQHMQDTRKHLLVSHILPHMNEHMPYLHSIYSSYQQLDQEHLQGTVVHNTCNDWFNEPRFTNYVQGFKGTLDYIMIVKDDLVKPLKLLKIPPLHLMKETSENGIPAGNFSSDHISLLCELEFSPLSNT